MRSATAPLVGAGVAAAASLAAWPVVILVANSPLVAAGENGAAAELMWGLLLGALGGASGAVASGAVSRRDGPRSAFAAVLAVAVRDRPLGVTPEAWLRYMNDVDVRGAATLGIGVATAVVERRDRTERNPRDRCRARIRPAVRPVDAASRVLERVLRGRRARDLPLAGPAQLLGRSGLGHST